MLSDIHDLSAGPRFYDFLLIYYLTGTNWENGYGLRREWFRRPGDRAWHLAFDPHESGLLSGTGFFFPVTVDFCFCSVVSPPPAFDFGPALLGFLYPAIAGSNASVWAAAA